ncbi:unnamed protein product [Brachionus calyciflorus]|uniref:SH2 domain-containing protein n=1 Tax=Brachionus calyciflorus TaxID=104777 RepID=A0A813SI68_9BILA|nr:unnamed protein product [Brachionus calyciflorus]
MNFNLAHHQNDLINQSQSILSSSSSNNCLTSYTNADFLYHLKQKQQNLTIVPIDKEAPSIDNWYHGRLDRNRSELLLREYNKTGSFLVRESEKTSGSYVLSYYSFDSKIHHFKITGLFGDYYIGGRQFDKLETLISYYMHYSELVKGEKLLEPLPPSRVCHLEKFYVCIKLYNRPKQSNANKIEFDLIQNLDNNNYTDDDDILYIDKIGELVRVFYEIGDGEWFWAQSCSTNEFGLLKADCVRYVEDDKLHEFEQWYYSNITKEEAVTILANAGNCSYLVRPSDQSPGDYTLFFIADNSVHRFRITGCVNRTSLNETEKYFHIGGRDYSSISAIIQRYMNEDITEGFRLTKIPHKRAENYPQDFAIIKDATNHQMSLFYNNSFSEKNNPKLRENLIKKHNSFIFDKTIQKKSENIPNGLSMSLNESSLKSVISTSNPTQHSSKLFNFRFSSKLKLNDKNQIKSQASINEPMNLDLKNSIMSKSLSSPLTFNNVLVSSNQKNDFYDSNEQSSDIQNFLKNYSSSSNSSNKSNEPSQSNSSTSSSSNSSSGSNNSNNSSQTEPDVLINKRLNKKIVLKGYLNKYSKLI